MKANQYSPKYWNEERNQWLIDNTKGLSRNDAYDLFCKTFPDEHITLTALCNQRSRLRCAAYTCTHTSTKQRPLYAEQVKSGYVNIKVAQPSVWWPKAKWVYIATHPEEVGEILPTDAFYFADGNNRNFDWKNIILVHRQEQPVFVGFGGVVPGKPEETKIHLLQARLKLKQLDVGEKLGLVTTIGNGRAFREDRNRKAREYHRRKYNNDEEYRNRVRRYAKEYNMRMTPEQRELKRAASNRYTKTKREEMKVEN